MSRSGVGLGRDDGKAWLTKRATYELEHGVVTGVFVGAAASVRWGQHAVDAYAGTLETVRLAARYVTAETTYDLASLTKPFVATAIMRLIAQGRLRWDTQVGSVMRAWSRLDIAEVTLEQLLSHRAGLPAWAPLYETAPHFPCTNKAIWWVGRQAAESVTKRADPAEIQATYSDLGYIVAAAVLCEFVRKPLERAIETLVTGPLAIADRVLFPSMFKPDKYERWAVHAAPTEHCEWRGRVLRGEVHDENASFLGGVAGHAGLFGTAPAVGVFAKAVLDSYLGLSDFLPAEILRYALRPQPGGDWRVGWDGKSAAGSSAGTRMSASSFGHLGFTGTSIWCDPERQLAVVLLSNRVHPSRNNEAIRAFRPAFHDGIVRAWDELQR
jgi:CubicO group peptidase (beta-lactamase class C family)